MDSLEKSDFIKQYVEDYELRGDEGDYIPTENEKYLILDAIYGIIDEPELRSLLSEPSGVVDYQSFQDDICAWSDSAFGPGERVPGMIAHLKKEADELARKPNDIVEMADCLILLLNIAGSQKISVDALFNVAKKKMIVNKNRKWTKINSDGSIEHE